MGNTGAVAKGLRRDNLGVTIDFAPTYESRLAKPPYNLHRLSYRETSVTLGGCTNYPNNRTGANDNVIISALCNIPLA